MINGNAPLTMLGIVVAAVARRFVPNCSAAMVTNIAQNPVAKPRKAATAYKRFGELPWRLKNKKIPIEVNA